MFWNRNLRIHRMVAAVAAACLLCAVCAAAQEAPAAPTAEPGPADQQPLAVIKKESRLVLVDAVVTDKKGNYIGDLTQSDFRVYEDNKEQTVSSFSSGTDAVLHGPEQKHYLILFFDNSTMQLPDQIQARAAAKKFVEANSSAEHLMAVVDFGGTLRIVQNFTANTELLQAAVGGAKPSNVSSNPQPITIASTGLPTISRAENDYGARTMLLAIRSLARNLRSVPGRKMLVLFSAGFPLTAERESELTATIDACNKANVAIYSLDVRGLKAPGGSAAIQPGPVGLGRVSDRNRSASANPRLILASYSFSSKAQQTRGQGGRPSGGPTGSGGSPSGAGGGSRGGAAPGGTGGTSGGGRGTGGAGSAGGGRPGGGNVPGGGRPGGTVSRPPVRTNYIPGYYNNDPNRQPRVLIPQFPESVATNQQILAALAEGTGGFTIFNTNDLLGGLERIGKEQNAFYILGYVPPGSEEGSCHTLKVKLNHGGMNVRARSGYCNTGSANPLEGKPIEKQMEARATASDTGSIHGSMLAPYFYTGPDTARVNLAMEIPPDTIKFEKEKGKYHATVNVLGIAYKPDGSVGARFSDVVNLDLEKDDWKDFEKGPYHYENQFDAAPGKYNLTVVLSADNDAFGKFSSPLQIDAFDGKEFCLGGVVLTNDAQRVDEIPMGMDSALLEDRTPLVIKGMQIVPSVTNRFKKSDNVILYTEIYEPLLTSDAPPQVGFGYRVIDRATDKEVFFTGAVRADDYIEKGNPIIPVGALLKVKELAPGGYKLIVLAADTAGHQAPVRTLDFDVID